MANAHECSRPTGSRGKHRLFGWNSEWRRTHAHVLLQDFQFKNQQTKTRDFGDSLRAVSLSLHVEVRSGKWEVGSGKCICTTSILKTAKNQRCAHSSPFLSSHAWLRVGSRKKSIGIRRIIVCILAFREWRATDSQICRHRDKHVRPWICVSNMHETITRLMGFISERIGR